ncbi:MAG: fibronectin type III domain-containing protein [Thermoplasmata archaeon]
MDVSPARYRNLSMIFVLCVLFISMVTLNIQGSTEAPELRATVEEEGILLEWIAPLKSGVTGYNIYRGHQDDLRYIYRHVESDENDYRDEDVEVGRTYKYWITALYEGVESRCSKTASVTIPERTVPTAPRNVNIYPGDSKVILTWERPWDNGNRTINNYIIFRSQGGEEFERIHTAGTVYEYLDTNVQNGIAYRYRVKARNKEGLSQGIEPDEVTPLSDVDIPEPPLNLRCFEGMDSVELLWEEPKEDGGTPVYRYNIYRDDLYIDTVRSTYYRDLDPTSASYSVSAVNALDESKQSVPVEGGVTGQAYDALDISIEHEVKEGSVHLNWDSVDHSTGYLVYRGEQPGSLYPYGITEDQEFIDHDTETDRRYYYRVMVLEGQSLTGESDTVGITNTDITDEGGWFDLSGLFVILVICLLIGAASVVVLFVIHRGKPKGPLE